jgi:DDE superfamily endonuclease
MVLADHVWRPVGNPGDGALYDGLNGDRIDVDRLRVMLAGLPLPRTADGGVVLAVDVSAWLHADDATSAQRLFCHVHGRARNQPQMIPAAAPTRSSPRWSPAGRPSPRRDPSRPPDNATAVTAGQLRAVVGRLMAARHWHVGTRTS